MTPSKWRDGYYYPLGTDVGYAFAAGRSGMTPDELEAYADGQVADAKQRFGRNPWQPPKAQA